MSTHKDKSIGFVLNNNIDLFDNASKDKNIQNDDNSLFLF